MKKNIVIHQKYFASIPLKLIKIYWVEKNAVYLLLKIQNKGF